MTTSQSLSKKEAQAKLISSINHSDTVSCGELACQHDSFKTILEDAKIVGFELYKEPILETSKGKGKKKSKGKASSPKVGPQEFAIAMSDSVFFPEGGGQPSDHGLVTLSRDEDNASKDTALEQVIAILQDSNTVVKQEIEWDRRYDLMTQHSAQHLCSAVALAKFNINTHTFSLGEKSNYSYIDFTTETDEELKEKGTDAATIFASIEEIVNNYIRADLPMTPTWLNPENESDAAILKEKARSRLLPKNLKGVIRLVEIGKSSPEEENVDFNTCCGTHVPSLRQLQMVKFFRMERTKPTIMRVYFAAGKRLMNIMNDMFQTQAQITAMLSCMDTEQTERVEQLIEDKKVRQQQVKTLNDKLCEFQANDVLASFKEMGDRIFLSIVDLGDVDMGYLTMIANEVFERVDRENRVILLLGGEKDADDGTFLLIGNESIVDGIGKDVAKTFNGRGGGNKGKFQGKGQNIRSALATVEQMLIDRMQ
ncbi:hypothetical protein CTEN210_09372 [Chaetoceros tenuissimus]|uniref:Threonyl/alanyl tRNA synthetase SAD domain-containing protein n=1 Tax=Chaetoceros tenuissimus TaxID=426638 RepID=A0AAD3CXE6_9STRA|nr:hypothetical protein CTEN210_09372 [Chaetoceros tenuissimus]